MNRHEFCVYQGGKHRGHHEGDILCCLSDKNSNGCPYRSDKLKEVRSATMNGVPNITRYYYCDFK